MIRAHVGGIAKEDLRFFPLRKSFDLRVFLLEPLLDQGLVALLRGEAPLLAPPYHWITSSAVANSQSVAR
jgi:hypothetical protein